MGLSCKPDIFFSHGGTEAQREIKISLGIMSRLDSHINFFQMMGCSMKEIGKRLCSGLEEKRMAQNLDSEPFYQSLINAVRSMFSAIG
jgi:hypothetical protein